MRAHLGLRQVAQREQRGRQLRLAELVQEIALVLAAVDARAAVASARRCRDRCARSGRWRCTRRPASRAASRKCLNLISRLHSTSGFGVRPAAYSARKCSNTPSQYSAEKSRKWNGMPEPAGRPRTRVAAVVLGRGTRRLPSSSAQFCMNSPAIGSPASRSSSAATEESTPPDMPTMIARRAHGGSAQVLRAASSGAGAGQEIRHHAPDQRAAVARRTGACSSAGVSHSALHDALVQRCDRRRGAPVRRRRRSAGSGGRAGCRRSRAPSTGRHRRSRSGATSQPVSSQRLAQRGIEQALVRLQVAGRLVEHQLPAARSSTISSRPSRTTTVATVTSGCQKRPSR